MSAWKTIRTFHLDNSFTFNDKLIPKNANYCLKQTPKGVEYWQAFWRDQGKMKSVHIGKELPFVEPVPVPSVNELLLSVSKLEKENDALRERIIELEQKDYSILSNSKQEEFKSIHIKTFVGMDNKLRAEAVILTLEYKEKIMQVNVYPNKEFAINYRPGKRLWKTIEQIEAKKVVSKWKKDEIKFSFAKSKNPSRVVGAVVSADITAQECKDIIF